MKSVEVMRAVDVAGITKAMAEAIEAAKDNDPEELKKQIKDLKKQLQDERIKPIDVRAGDISRLQDQIAELNRVRQVDQDIIANYAVVLENCKMSRPRLNA